MGAFPAKMSIVEKLFALTFAMIAVGVRAAITEIPSSGGYVYKYLFSATFETTLFLFFQIFSLLQPLKKRANAKRAKRRNDGCFSSFYPSLCRSIRTSLSVVLFAREIGKP